MNYIFGKLLYGQAACSRRDWETNRSPSDLKMTALPIELSCLVYTV